jgi:hypothetical protein
MTNVHYDELDLWMGWDDSITDEDRTIRLEEMNPTPYGTSHTDMHADAVFIYYAYADGCLAL